MNAVRVRKNFLIDKEIMDKAQQVIHAHHKNLTEAITLYFKAITKEPAILEQIEESANKRTGSFIGMLDGKIGDKSYKTMRKELARSEEEV